MSDDNNGQDALKKAILSQAKTIAPKSVLINLGLTAGLSLITIITFNILRPRNRVIYEPKAKYFVGDKQPPRIKNGFFSWLSPLVYTKEPELLEKVGPDAVIFLRFLRMLRWMFTTLAFFACAITLPVDIVATLHLEDGLPKNPLTMLTIQDVNGNLLFVHVGATYLFTFIVLSFIWYHWRAVVKVRHDWFRSDEYNKSFYARTLMVQHVPRKLQSDEGLQSLFESLRVPYPTTAVHIGRRVGNLPELIEYHNQAVCDLESYLVLYLKDGQLGKKRPTIRKGGFLGIGSKKYDAIDFYSARIKTAQEAIDRARSQIDLKKAENYGFASMGAVPYAHIVAKILDGKSKKGTAITLAPNPKDLIWKNIVRSDAGHASGQFIGFLLLALVCAFYTIPLTIISFVANLAAIQAWVPWLQTWGSASPKTFALVSGVLPPAISALFGWMLPRIMRSLSKYQGALTRSKLDRSVVARYFGFLVISQLIIFTLISVLYQLIALVVLEIGRHESAVTILKNFTKLPGQIQTTYIQGSSYWLTFFPLRGFLAFFDLAQLINLVLISVKTKLFGRTPRDIREWTKPPSFEYAVYFSNMLFMACVAMVYTPLAPLVPVLAAVVFWISSVVYKYQLMYIFTTKVESGGRLWNVVTNRLMASAIFMQLLMVLTIGLVHGWTSFLWVSMIPPIFIVIIFKIWLNAKYMKAFRYYVPDEAEIARSKVFTERADSRLNKLEKRFGHPALHAELYTPMVHSSMVNLLPQVYHGRLSEDRTDLQEYGGQKVNAALIGGLKIAGIDQSDLEYDPALYQRDRGEADWDTRSISSTNLLHESTPSTDKAEYFTPHSRAPSVPLTGYEQYMAHGPVQQQSASQFELARLDYNRTTDNLPLLGASNPSITSIPEGFAGPGAYPPRSDSPRTRYEPSEYSHGGWDQQPMQPQAPPLHISDSYRTAPTHRGYTPSPSMSNDSPVDGGATNMAGRGARRHAY